MPGCSGAPNESKPARLQLAVDDRLVCEGAARAAVFLRHGGAQQPRRAGLGPHLALVHAGFVPALNVRCELRGNKSARLLFEQDKVLAHPGCARKVENIHGQPLIRKIPRAVRRREQPSEPMSEMLFDNLAPLSNKAARIGESGMQFVESRPGVIRSINQRALLNYSELCPQRQNHTGLAGSGG